MSLHTIAPELNIKLTEKEKQGIANFLNHYNGAYPVAVVRTYARNVEKIFYYSDNWIPWYNVDDWANGMGYGSHEFFMSDIHIFPGPHPEINFVRKEYVRHD